MIKKFGDIIAGIFFLLFALGMYVASFSIKTVNIAKIGPDFVPKIVAILVALISLSLLINGLRELKEKSAKKISKDNNPRKARVIASIILMFIYVLLLEKVGFLIMTIIYLFSQFYVLAEQKRNIPLFLTVSAVVAVSVYYIFIKVFYLMLPSGILG